MNVKRLRRTGLPLFQISHLCYGTKTINGAGYYHDANLCGVQADGKIFPPDDEFSDEIRRINGMEKNLSPLSNDLIELRTQIDLCCVWRYDFPENLNGVLNAIGIGKSTFIRMHGQIDPDRRQKIMSFGKVLRGWLDGVDVEGFSNEWDKETVSWVYAALGERSKLKELLVKKACLTLGARWLDCSFWGEMTVEGEIELKPDHTENVPEDWRERVKILAKEIQQILPDVKDWGDLNGGQNPPCHFKFTHRLRTGIFSIGHSRWLGGKIPALESFKERKVKVARIVEILKYWLEGVPLDKAIRKCSEPAKTLKRIYDLLGEKNAEKEWLVESLKCNMQHQTRYNQFSMQRWVKMDSIKETLLKQPEIL